MTTLLTDRTILEGTFGFDQSAILQGGSPFSNLPPSFSAKSDNTIHHVPV